MVKSAASASFLEAALITLVMFTLKLDEFKTLPPATEKGRRRRGVPLEANKRSKSHVTRENEQRTLVPNIEELLFAERTRTARLEQQVKAQSALISTLISQKEVTTTKQWEVEESPEPMNRLLKLQGRVLEAVDVISAKALARAKTQEVEVESLCNARVRTARQDWEKEAQDWRARLAEKDKELQELCKLATDLKAGWARSTSDLNCSQKRVSELQLQVSTLELAKSLLHKQILELKRSNLHLRTEHSQLLSRAVSPLPLRKSSTPARPERVSEHREGAVSHLRHLLELERKNLRAAKSALADELRDRAGLESGLKDALCNLKVELDTAKSKGSAGGLVEVLEGQRKLLEALRERAAGLSSAYTGLQLVLPEQELGV